MKKAEFDTKIIEGYITNCIIGEITKENLLKKLFEARFSFLSSRRDIIKITRENIQKKDTTSIIYAPTKPDL